MAVAPVLEAELKMTELLSRKKSFERTSTPIERNGLTLPQTSGSRFSGGSDSLIMKNVQTIVKAFMMFEAAKA